MDSTIREFYRGNTHYLAEALEQPILLLKGYEHPKRPKVAELISVPEKGLSSSKSFDVPLWLRVGLDFSFFFYDRTLSCRFCAGHLGVIHGRRVGERCPK